MTVRGSGVVGLTVGGYANLFVVAIKLGKGPIAVAPSAPTAVLIVAAGRGARAGSDVSGHPKQYRNLAGASVLARTVEAFVTNPRIHLIQVVIHPDDATLYAGAMGALVHRCRPPVTGGATRQASVLAGLEALAITGPDCVLIHDAARPFVTAAEVGRVLTALATRTGAIAAVPMADTLKRASPQGTCAGTVARAGLWAAQTPQGFHFEPIYAAHRAAAEGGHAEFTDDAAIAEWAGLDVALVQGSAGNVKLTTPDDFAAAERMLAAGSTGPTTGSSMIDVRTGTGFDVHRFAAGNAVWLCGVRIPHTQKLEGHSDADVGLHALTDAILGALGDGDIGQHFPPSDMQWKGAASDRFLADAVRRTHARGARITNADVTLLCEAPKIAPHRDAMRAAMAAILGIGIERVGVKATTTEGLGFTGRREGIAAMASATLVF